MATLKADIKRAVYKEWEQEWTSQSTAHHTRSFYSKPCPLKAKFVYKLARLELGRFLRIISGHNNLNFFQTKIGLWGDPRCRFCGGNNETVMHLVHSCPCFHTSRREIFTNGPPSGDLGWSVRELLSFSYIPAINSAFEGSWAHGDTLAGQDLNSLDGSSAMSTDQSEESEA